MARPRLGACPYHAAMTMRGDSLPFEPWEGLPHRWQLIYRVQARAVLDLLSGEPEPTPGTPLDQDALDFTEVS